MAARRASRLRRTSSGSTFRAEDEDEDDEDDEDEDEDEDDEDEEEEEEGCIFVFQR